MRPEKEFFQFAFTCAEGKLQRGVMSPERYAHLKELYENGKYPPTSELEASFGDAVPFLHELAERMHLNSWDIRVVREYWLRYHNLIIDEGKGVYAKMPPAIKNFCKVHLAKVISVHENYIDVEYDGERHKALYFRKGIRVGDPVAVHKGQVVKRLSKKEVEEYLK